MTKAAFASLLLFGWRERSRNPVVVVKNEVGSARALAAFKPGLRRRQLVFVRHREFHHAGRVGWERAAVFHR
jgi:hypothetical protein